MSALSKATLSAGRGVWGPWGTRGVTGARVQTKPHLDDGEFRVLDFLNRRQRVQRPQLQRTPVPPPRALAMRTDQHWPSVWPGPRTFHPGTVPLPLRQGYPLRLAVAPSAHANAELMKIPNFLHLTPPAVKDQCEALKPFCTKWPESLNTIEKCEEKFPLEIITSDYCHSGPSIRDPLSRIVSIRIKLSKLPLDKHAKDKLRRLVDDRYDEKTDMFTIITDRCPTRKQNLDYAMYLLTAIFHESWTVEDWEAEKSEADMEEYIWENNESRRSVVRHFSWKPNEECSLSSEDIEKFDLTTIPEIDGYKEAVSEYFNTGENDYQIQKYKKSVLKLLGLPISEKLEISDINKM